MTGVQTCALPIYDRGNALNTGGIVLSVVGGALAVGGAVWAIVPSRKERAQPEIAK